MKKHPEMYKFRDFCQEMLFESKLGMSFFIKMEPAKSSRFRKLFAYFFAIFAAY